MTAVSSSVLLLFLFSIGLFFSLPQQARANDLGGMTLTQDSNGISEGDHSPDTGTGADVGAEVSVRVIYLRTAKGSVAIEDRDPEGRFVLLKNINLDINQDVNLGNWSLKSQVVNHTAISFTLPHSVVIKAGKTLKIWAGGFSSEAHSHDLVFRGQDSWGTGPQVVTTLLNDKDEEQASLIQKTTVLLK